MSVTIKRNKFNDYLGMPVHTDLKHRIARLARKKFPPQKMIPLARALLERAVGEAEQEISTAK